MLFKDRNFRDTQMQKEDLKKEVDEFKKKLFLSQKSNEEVSQFCLSQNFKVDFFLAYQSIEGTQKASEIFSEKKVI